jgi:hypothetical protein
MAREGATRPPTIEYNEACISTILIDKLNIFLDHVSSEAIVKSSFRSSTAAEVHIQEQPHGPTATTNLH